VEAEMNVFKQSIILDTYRWHKPPYSL